MKALWDAIETAHAIPFAWGANDCVTFTAWVTDRIHGTDYLTQAKQQHSWRDKRSAVRALRAAGGLEAATTAALGPPMPPALCTIGDVVLVRNRNRHLLAIHDGHAAVARGARGLVVLPLEQVVKGWRPK